MNDAKQERRVARLELLLTKSERRLLELAAAKCMRTLSDFVRVAALVRAEEIMEAD
jgi:uncharacterized protein (DUF1778 family)